MADDTVQVPAGGYVLFDAPGGRDIRGAGFIATPAGYAACRGDLHEVEAEIVERGQQGSDRAQNSAERTAA
jgi:hypothetical protein